MSEVSVGGFVGGVAGLALVMPIYFNVASPLEIYKSGAPVDTEELVKCMDGVLPVVEIQSEGRRNGQFAQSFTCGNSVVVINVLGTGPDWQRTEKYAENVANDRTINYGGIVNASVASFMSLSIGILIGQMRGRVVERRRTDKH